MSLANKVVLKFDALGKLYMYRRNNSGPKQDLCSTPHFTCNKFEFDS